MKTGLLRIAVVLFFSGSALAQNTFPATGNVGIGTTSPPAPLTVDATAGSGVLINHAADNSPMQSLNIQSIGGRGLWFVASGCTVCWNSVTQQNDQGLYFSGAGSGTGNLVIAPWGGGSGIRITSSGNVGVGLPNPEHHLEVLSNVPISTDEWSSHGLAVASADGNADANSTMIWMDTDRANNVGYIQAYQRSNGARPLILQGGPGGGGNVGIGTKSPGAKLEVNGSIKLTSGSGASMTFPDNSVQSTAWNGTTCGGDYAESVDVAGDWKAYEPGDVLVIDPKSPDKFLRTDEPYSALVAGVYSTKPGLTGRRQGAAATGEEVPMALVGIVPTKVSAENGPIKPGTLLVTSSTPGYAMRGSDREKLTGAIIGKAMGSLDEGKGVIEVLVALQ